MTKIELLALPVLMVAGLGIYVIGQVAADIGPVEAAIATQTEQKYTTFLQAPGRYQGYRVTSVRCKIVALAVNLEFNCTGLVMAPNGTLATSMFWHVTTAQNGVLSWSGVRFGA